MTELDVERLRAEEFPVTRTSAYLDHATFSPLPASHLRAATAFYEKMGSATMEPPRARWEAGMDSIRSKIGRLVNCEPGEVAFAKSAAEAMSWAAGGLDWRPGDEVVVYDREFPSGVYTWLNLADRGVKVRFIRDGGRAKFTLDDVEGAITDRTRLVCTSMVSFENGFRAPVEAIGEICRSRGIWFVVDATQAAGALRVDVRQIGADLVAVHGYKFLASGHGNGFCYCSPRARSELRPVVVGWKSMADPYDAGHMLDYRFQLAAEARRFEPSSQNYAALLGMAASIDIFLDAGPERVAARVLDLSRRLAAALDERGFEVVSSRAEGERSGIVSARRKGIDSDALQAELARQGVRCSVREGVLRTSVHFYNTADDIARLQACLPR